MNQVTKQNLTKQALHRLTTVPEMTWAYRTTEPVVVANEPTVPPEPVVDGVVVYPKPTMDEITVEATGREETVFLYDLIGRVVFQVELIAGKAMLDMSRLPAGVYVVRVGMHAQPVTVL